MRLLYISQYYPPEVGATQNRGYEMAHHLVSKGHEVTMLTEVPNHPTGVIHPAYRGRLYQRSLEEGIEVIRVWVKTSPSKTSRTRLAFYGTFMVNATLAGLLLARGQYDLAYVTSPPLFVGGTALALKAIRRLPFVFEVRDLWPESAVALGELKNKRYIRWATSLEEICYRRSCHIVVVTEGIRRQLLQRGIADSKVAVIPNGANTDLHRPMAEGGSRVRAELGLTGKFVIVYAGLLGIAQSLPTLIEAARSLAGESVHLILVGDGPARSELEKLVRTYALSNVTFTGAIPRAQVPNYLAAADLGVVILADRPLFRWALPSKLFDILACERPVLLSAPEGEAAAVLRQSGGGVSVEPEAPEAIANAVRGLRRQPDQLRQFGQAGRRFVKAHYSRQAQAAQLETLLSTIAAKRSMKGIQ